MISPMHPITQNNHRGRMYRLTLLAALLVTACAPTQGAVVDADHTPGWTTTTVRCAPKAPDRCTPQMLHSTSTYRLKLSDGTTTRWHTVPEGDYHQCPVGARYPTCARGESHGDTAWTTLNSSDK